MCSSDLYLIRYIDDIPSNLDNIVILMADDIRVDKIIMREAVRGCLDRLMSQNYIGRTGDTYNFLTDEEQDIQREIRDTNVDTASIVERIAQMIYGDIFTTKKFRYGKYDFAFDQMVDGITVGVATSHQGRVPAAAQTRGGGSQAKGAHLREHSRR